MVLKDIIDHAFALIGVGGFGISNSAEEYEIAVRTLNVWLDTISNDRDATFTTDRLVFSLIPGQQSYTLGPDGNWDAVRPVKIDEVSVIVSNSSPTYEIPISIIDTRDWQNISVKNISSIWPTQIYFDGDAPYNTAYVWPIPTTAAQIAIYSWSPFNEYSITDLQAAIDLPKGYASAMSSNLAVALAPIFGKEPSMVLVQSAMRSYNALQDTNNKTPKSICSYPGASGSGNIQAIRSRGWVIN